MKIEFNGTVEELQAFFDTIGAKKSSISPYVFTFMSKPDENPSLEDAVKNETMHYSTSKNITLLVKDMEKFHLMASLKNQFRDGKLGELYDDVEFKSMILNLADYIGADLEEEEHEKQD